jgi:hypothetical protein
VEREAGPLQFFLWYCDYIQRWTALPTSEKVKVARWDPDNKRPVTSHSRSGSLKEKAKLGAILDILECEPQAELPQRNNSTTTNFSLPRSPAPVATTAIPDEKKGWAPFSDQPFRDEVTKIVRHYIFRGSPRQLNLSPEDRAACVHAVEHTTHPSALLPAFVSADSVLRGRLYPNFIQWSISNSNRPLVIFLRLLSGLLFFLGVGLEALFVLSSWSPLWRISSFPLFFGAFAIMITSASGMCLLLHFTTKRQLRPWEQASDLEEGRMKMSSEKNAKYLDHEILRDMRMGSVDPLRKASLQTFGPKNEFADEEWVAAYEKKWLFRRIVDVSVRNHNNYIRVLQNSVVASAVLWGGLIAVALCASCYFIPSFGMF